MGDFSSLICYYKNNLHDVNNIYGLGFHHQFITKNYQKMEKYYFKAIQLGDRDSHINYTNKYIKDANDGDVNAMVKLGYYYQYIYVDVKCMFTYYYMAIEHKSVIAMNMLAYYYYLTGNYENMKTLYLMAIELGHVESMDELGQFYERVGDYEQMEYYYLLSNNVGLVSYYLKNVPSAFLNKDNRYKIVRYLNKIPLKTVGLDKLVFQLQFTIDDDLTPTLRKFICLVHEQQVKNLDSICLADIQKINYGFLSISASTTFYYYCKDNLYKIGKECNFIRWALSLYEPTINFTQQFYEGKVIKKCKNHIIRLALVDLYRKNLTMKELKMIQEGIMNLPTWLYPYQ